MSHNNDTPYVDSLSRIRELSLEATTVTHADSPYTLGSSTVLLCDVTAGPVTVVLAVTTPLGNRTLSIHVDDPTATGNAVTFSPAAGDTTALATLATHRSTCILTRVGSVWISSTSVPVVATHAPSHLPSGADPLTTGTAVSVSSANTEGIADSFARSDHTHRGVSSIVVDSVDNYDAVTFEDSTDVEFSASAGTVTASLKPLTVDVIVFPTMQISSATVYAVGTSFAGCVYDVTRRISGVDSVLLRLNSVVAPPVLTVAFYQTATGNFGNGQLIASCNTTLSGGGINLRLMFNEGAVDFRTGYLYILFGRTPDSGGTVSISAYNTAGTVLIANSVYAGTAPLAYTTAITASVPPPATFDPTVEGTGSAGIDNLPIIRFMG